MRKGWITIGFILILIGALQWIYNYRNKKELSACKRELSNCFVYETNYLYIKTSGLWVYYRYSVDNKNFEGRCNLGLEYEDELKKELLNKVFPVTYCRDKPHLSTVLILPKQFIDYGYTFPSSLKWVEGFKRNRGSERKSLP